MRIKFAQLRRVASELGYDGKVADTSAMLSYLADDAGWRPTMSENGKTFTLTAEQVKALKVEQSEDMMSVLVTQVDEEESGGEEAPPEEGASLPKDLDALVDAKVHDRLKRMGIHGGERRGMPSVEVKSADERIWEDRVARGQIRAFKTFDHARGAALWIRSLIQNDARYGDIHNPEASRKSLGMFNDWARRKAYTTLNTPAVVPDAFLPDLIRLVEEQGVARKIARMVPMPARDVTIPRRTGGLTGTYPNEANASADSSATYDNVNLRAKTFVVNTTVSKEILQDSGLAFADITFEEIAYCIASKEDDAVINGDGTSTYGGIVGLKTKFGTTIADTGSYVTGAGTALLHDAEDLARTMARLPLYARNRAAWLCSPEMSSTIFDRIGAGAGGTTYQELAGYGWTKTYGGRPIVHITTAATAEDASGDAIDAYFGDFAMGIMFGERMQIELNTDESVKFKEYAVALQGVVRHDIVVHDIGNTTTAGPIISLWQT